MMNKLEENMKSMNDSIIKVDSWVRNTDGAMKKVIRQAEELNS